MGRDAASRPKSVLPKSEKVRRQVHFLRQFYPVERSPRADAGPKCQGTARFGREPLDCDVGKRSAERSLSALFLSTFGLYLLRYGTVSN